MRNYTLYFLAGDGLRTQSESFVCESEDFALRIVRNWAEEEPIELWEGSRRIFPPRIDAAA